MIVLNDLSVNNESRPRISGTFGVAALWLLAAVLAVPVFILMLIASFKEFRQSRKNRRR